MKTIHKYFIENLVITDENAPSKWTEEDWLKYTKGHACIGYLFTTKDGAFGTFGKILNLYLINRKYYRQSEVDLNELKTSYARFEINCLNYPSQKQYTKRIVFKNPPIEEWLKTKDNWIAKTAKDLSNSWQISYDEALSSIYFIVVKFYHRSDVYMGNLNYIYTGVLNKLRGKERYDKNRLYGKNVISGDSPRYIDKEGNVETWFDTVGVEDTQHLERDYLEFVSELRNFMSKDFSQRELDQIFSVDNVMYLPDSLYVRLLRWRKKHSREEVLKLL